MIVKFAQIQFDTETRTFFIDGYNTHHHFIRVDDQRYICRFVTKFVDPVTGRIMDRMQLAPYNEESFVKENIDRAKDKYDKKAEDVEVKSKKKIDQLEAEYKNKLDKINKSIEEEVNKRVQAEMDFYKKNWDSQKKMDQKNVIGELEIKIESYKKDIELLKKTILNFQKTKDTLNAEKVEIVEEVDDLMNGITTASVILTSEEVSEKKTPRKKKSDKISVN